MHWCRKTPSRCLTSLLIFTVALGALTLAALVVEHPSAVGADAAPATTARDTVDLQFLVVDGDSDTPGAMI